MRRFVEVRAPFRAKPFGQDCLGNCSGYVVVDANGAVVDTWIANIYERGSHERAKEYATRQAELLNSPEYAQ